MKYSLFITGGRGQIGQTLIRSLRQDVQLLKGDLHSLAQNSDQIPEGTIVLHLAAKTHARNKSIYDRVNIEGTKILLDVAKKRHCQHFIFVSTRAIDKTGGPYSQSKRASEELVRLSGLPYTIIRFGEIIGASRNGIDRILSSIGKNRPVFLPGDGRDAIAPLMLSDAVTLLQRTIVSPPTNETGTYTGPEYTLKEFIEQRKLSLNSSSLIILLPHLFLRILSFIGRVAPIGFAPDQLDRLRSPKVCSPKFEKPTS